MMNTVLKALYARLSTDTDLLAFFNTHYGKPLNHLIGYKKALKADDYPMLSYVRTKGDYGLNGHDNGLNVSLVLGIHDERLLDESGVIIPDDLTGSASFLAFSGVQKSSDGIELIINSLLKDEQIGNFFLTSNFFVFDEVPPNTPFFNTELAFSLSQLGSRKFGHG